MTPFGGDPPRRSRCTRHILFQTTPGRVWTWSGPSQRRPWGPLLAVPDDFAACALIPSNCPSGDKAPISGGSAGRRAVRVGAGSVSVAADRDLARACQDTPRISHRHRPASPGGHFRSRLPLDHVAERLKAGVEERHAGNRSRSGLVKQRSGLDLRSACSKTRTSRATNGVPPRAIGGDTERRSLVNRFRSVAAPPLGLNVVVGAAHAESILVACPDAAHPGLLARHRT
jgi:hypothetical protein